VDLGSYNGTAFELGIRDTSALVANFYKADREIERAMIRHVREITEIFDSVWESLTPVDTAFMVTHRHIRLTKSGLGFEAGWDASEFLNAGFAFYPFFQEFGTRMMAAQPSLGPAYRYIEPIFRDGTREIVQAAIARLNQGSAR